MIYNETRYNTHWNTKKLNELGEFARGKSRHRPRNDTKLFENGKYPLIQTGEVKAANFMITKHEQEYSEFGLQQSKLWDAGTLCITIAANIAETGILAYPMCFPDSVVGFNAYPTESSEAFMHYIFTFIRNSIQNSVNGSIQDNINIEYLSTLDFKVPDKPYQDKIVHVLSLLDRKIELNNCIFAELEDMAKIIYDYWFVQFNFPDERGKPYKTSSGKMIWNQELKREIPEGWKAGKLSDFADITTGKLDSNQGVLGGKYPFFTCAPEPLTIDSYAFDDSVILIAGNNAAGNFHINRYKGKFNAYQRTYVLIAKSIYDIHYLYYSLKLELNRLKDRSQGSQTKFLTLPLLNSFSIYKLDKEVSKRFYEIINPVFEKQNIINQENRKLSEMRDWLLTLLINGQVTVE